MTIEIPPLRDRLEDTPLLAETFARAAAARPIGQGTLRRLVEYGWPGNVRELRNTMDRAVIMAEGDELARAIFLVR